MNKLLPKPIPQSLLFWVCAAITTGSFAESDLRTASRYQVLDSRTMTFGSDPKFFWLDDNELVFVSILKFPDGSTPSGEQLTYSIRRWNVRTGAVTLVRDFGTDRPFLCFYDGFLLYSALHKAGAPAYQARLGEFEREVNRKEYEFLFCQHRDKIPKLPDWTKGREVRLLQKLGAGFVDFGDRQKWLENTPVHLYRYNMKQEEGIELPLGRRDSGKRFPYYQFKRAFFVESDYYRHPRPREIPYPVYWLYENGNLEKIADIPWGPWRERASFWVIPVQVGLLMGSHNARGRDIGHAGLYLFREGRVEKILRGWVQGTQISPDGCVVAYSYAPVMTDKNHVLQAIDVCKGVANDHRR